MRAGRLRHRIEIQTFTESADAYGQPAKTWATEATVWGSIAPMVGKEYIESQRVDSTVTHRVRLRYYDGLTTTHRLKYGSRTFGITSVLNPFERDRETVVMCIEDT